MFITFEGPDGSGKSTQAKLLYEYLCALGKAVVLTREPGGSPLGKNIRNILLEDKSMQVSPLAELLLFCADRAEHVSKVIRPALAEKKIVLCDRYIDSTTAYQSGGRGFDLKMIETLNNYSTAGLQPDLTIYIDIAPAAGLARASKYGSDKFEAESLSFHERVRAQYLQIVNKEPRCLTFDGEQTIEDVFAQIKERLTELLV